MKVIELAFKISKGELEDKTKVLFKKNDCLTIYHKKDNRFEFYEKGDWNSYYSNIDIEELNDEVEIIEEQKGIEKLEIENDSPTYFYIRNEHGTKCSLTKHSKIIAEKINELVQKVVFLESAVNELKGKE